MYICQYTDADIRIDCPTVVFSLSVAAFLRRAGSSMLESTGSHGRGVKQRVSETFSDIGLTSVRTAVDKVHVPAINKCCSSG